MRIQRVLRHLRTTGRRVRQLFPPDSLHAITQAIRAAEAAHGGEICLVIEAALPTPALWRGMTARQRALQVFAEFQVWDTEHNNGVLIYLLLADQAVEIVADRHIHRKVGAATWQLIANGMQREFARHAYPAGALHGIHAVAELLAQHFPAPEPDTNTLPDAPILL